jgi:phosphoribosylformylglycinamidine cyclo-ligase
VEERTGLALSTDGVGTKVIIAEQLGRYDTVGIDCVAMNANDLVCVGAEPLALLDYLAVEQADPDVLREIAVGLRAGAEEAGVAIPGGELAQLPELIRGHPSPHGFDLVGSCIGLVPLDAIVTGARIEPGDAVIGLPSSGIHANGLTLARHVAAGLAEGFGTPVPGDPAGRPYGEVLLDPAPLYGPLVEALLDGGVPLHYAAHVTGHGWRKLMRAAQPLT